VTLEQVGVDDLPGDVVLTVRDDEGDEEGSDT
jgi:hypothetical protein